MDKLRVASLNARGLKNKLKRTSIFNLLKKQKVDIVCIQEAHVNTSDARIWQKQWGGKIIFDDSSENNKREMFLISKNVTQSIGVEICQDRVLGISVKSNNEQYIIVNVYAPNDSMEKIRFFNILQKILTKYSNDKLIICGDFNCVLDNEKDIISGRPHSKVEVREFNQNMSKLDVHDVWRSLNPDDKEYSWNRYNPFIARRLDYCFASEEMLPNCVQCEYLFIPQSDHKALVLEFNDTKFIRGPGHWRFNNSFLKDLEFIKQMNKLLEQYNLDVCTVSNTRDAWEMCKIDIKEFCSEYGKLKSKQKKKEMATLLNMQKDIENKIKTNTKDKQLQNDLFKIKQKLEIHQAERARGAQVRSRVKWIQEGEQNTKYFLNLEKVRNKQNTITRLQTARGEVITKQQDIMKEQVRHFTELYSATTQEDISESVATFINNEEFPKLTDYEADLCEGPITLEEISRALSLMHNGSAPGVDGITVEFIKFFWKKIGKLVTQSFKQAFELGQLSETQKRGVITLIHKGKDLSREDLNCWRPITLTNTDYKIIAKTMSERLIQVIHRLVSKDQVGYLKGRNISTVIRTIDDTINYLNKTGKAGYLLALDFAKAFDNISKPYLIHVFEVFGFGNDFKRWIEVLNNGNVSCIKHCGWTSEPIKLNCGIRQGCPLSPLIFILAAELMAIKIRNSNIEGIELPCTGEITDKLIIKQMADDTTLFVKNKNDMEIAKVILEEFSIFSGLRLNAQKTKAMKLGTQELEANLPFIVTEKINILGIVFQRDKMAKYIEDNWNNRILKLNNLIKTWSQRDLSFHGKVIIIKTYLMSQFGYVMQSIGLPENVLGLINRTMYKFLWQRKFSNRKAFEKIKRKIMQQDYDKGGLNMIDMIEIQKYYYLQWAGRLHFSEENWTKIPMNHYKKLANQNKIFEINIKIEHFKLRHYIENEFWQDVLMTYLKMKPTIRLEDTDETFEDHLIFHNSLILYKKHTLFFQGWIKHGIEKMSDIINYNEKRLYSYEEIENKIKQNKAVTLFQYNALINAIPTRWKELIRNGFVKAVHETALANDFFVRKLNQKLKEIRNIIKKMENNDDKIQPHASTIWQMKCNYNITKKTWLVARLSTKETRLRELHWKIMHNIYPTNILLQKMKVTDTNKCDYCWNKIDYMEHFFYECDFVYEFWCCLENTIYRKINQKVKISKNTVLFGLENDDFPLDQWKYVNLVILIGKLTISIFKKTKSKMPLTLLFDHQCAIRSVDI